MSRRHLGQVSFVQDDVKNHHRKGWTYVLPAAAERNDSSIWKFLKVSCERMTSGRCIPAAVKAMPKAEPQKIVVNVFFASIVSVWYNCVPRNKSNDQREQILDQRDRYDIDDSLRRVPEDTATTAAPEAQPFHYGDQIFHAPVRGSSAVWL